MKWVLLNKVNLGRKDEKIKCCAGIKISLLFKRDKKKYVNDHIHHLHICQYKKKSKKIHISMK